MNAYQQGLTIGLAIGSAVGFFGAFALMGLAVVRLLDKAAKEGM